MKKLLDVSINKIYIMLVILISLFMLGGYFSYAMFTVTKEKSNAISIVTGNLVYDLKVDGKEGNTLVIPANTTIEFTVTLSNPNNRIARFNFYYLESLPDGVTAGYVVSNGFNIPMSEVGSNLEKSGTSGSSNTYKIKVTNANDSEITINLGVEVGLDYNDLSLPSNGHLFEEYKVNVSDIVLTSPGENGDTYDDGTDTFITGEDPNNYIWYSGKLWRAVSVNNEEKTTKLVTQWNISTITYNSSGNTAFSDSYVEDWLNDTTIDGFLYNLRDYEKFVVIDSQWDATLDATSLGSITKPNGNTKVTATVGLLNMYEYQESFRGTDYNNGYLNNGLYFWTLTPYNSSLVRRICSDGSEEDFSTTGAAGIRPSINLKDDVHIIDGEGTKEDPYRLEGDNDNNLSGTHLKERYSGEYIRFGTGENLYRIVSHENGVGTKITSAEPLKSSNGFVSSGFGSSVIFSSTNIIGTFLNGNYLTNYVGNNYNNMIEDTTTWYLGTTRNNSYKLAKYTDTTGTTLTSSRTTSKVGLLRYGELMSGQFERYAVKGGDSSTGLTVSYWTLTPYSNFTTFYATADGVTSGGSSASTYGVKPSLNLKENIIITNGTGTKEDPFIIKEE